MTRISVHNLCKQPIFVEDHDKDDKTLLIAPNSLETVQRIAKKKMDKSVTTIQLMHKGDSNVMAVSLSLLSRTSARRRHHRTTIDLPDVGHRIEVLSAYCDDEKTSTVQLLPYRDPARWMASLPDKTLLSTMTLPATHETCALHGWPIFTCQSTSIPDQLQAGIRFLDIRLSIKGPKKTLVAYHDIQPQHILFCEILSHVDEFLRENPSECIILCVKQENGVEGFEDRVYEQVEKHRPWWVGSRVPTLGEVRGTVVMFSRFGIREDNGLHISVWPNNSSTVWTSNMPDNVDVTVQDWYDIGSIVKIRKKANLVIQSLSKNVKQPQNTSSSWVFSYMSASSPLLAFPFICARGICVPFTNWGVEGINSRVLRWLLTHDPEGMKLQGCVVICDYWETQDGALVRWLIECNF